MVFSSLGRTTLSKALTRRLVVLMASSSVRKAVCRLANSTSSFTEATNACKAIDNRLSELLAVLSLNRKSQKLCNILCYQEACGWWLKASAICNSNCKFWRNLCQNDSMIWRWILLLHLPYLSCRLDLLAARSKTGQVHFGAWSRVKLLKFWELDASHIVCLGMHLHCRLHPSDQYQPPSAIHEMQNREKAFCHRLRLQREL